MKVTDVPSQKACDPLRGPVRRPRTPAGAFPPAGGALAPDPGANVPQPEKASSHLTQPGCSQPSRLPPALWLRAGDLYHNSDHSLVQPNTSQWGSQVCHPPKYPSIFPWRVTQGEEHLLQLFLSFSPALILQGWLAVYPANPCGMWFALGRRAGGRVRSAGTARSSEGALLPAGAGAVVLNWPYPLCKRASLIPNYLAVCTA